MINVPGNISAESKGNAPRIGVFVSDPNSEAVIRQSLGDIGYEPTSVTMGNVETAASALAKQPSPRLLIVDITGVEDPVASILELAEVCEADIGVVAIGPSNDIVLYRQLKNAGVVEYFFKPLVRDQVARSCHDVLTGRFDQPSLYAGKLIFMLGVRGGVGATTIATNAAWRLAESRQRWTLLVDLDQQNGDTVLQLDTTPSHALREALEHPDRVDKLFLERGVIRVTKRLNLMATLENLGEVTPDKEEAIGSLLENLLRRYRVVFVDLPSTVAVTIPHVLQFPSTCVLVANASLSAARDMARWRDLLGANTRERRTLNLLNHNAAHGNLPEAEFARAAGGAPDIVIGYDREMAEAANFGTRAMQKCNIFRQGMMRMLHDVTGEPIEQPQSLFKRIFAQ